MKALTYRKALGRARFYARAAFRYHLITGTPSDDMIVKRDHWKIVAENVAHSEAEKAKARAV